MRHPARWNSRPPRATGYRGPGGGEGAWLLASLSTLRKVFPDIQVARHHHFPLHTSDSVVGRMALVARRPGWLKPEVMIVKLRYGIFSVALLLALVGALPARPARAAWAMEGTFLCSNIIIEDEMINGRDVTLARKDCSLVSPDGYMGPDALGLCASTSSGRYELLVCSGWPGLLYAPGFGPNDAMTQQARALGLQPRLLLDPIYYGRLACASVDPPSDVYGSVACTRAIDLALAYAEPGTQYTIPAQPEAGNRPLRVRVVSVNGFSLVVDYFGQQWHLDIAPGCLFFPGNTATVLSASNTLYSGAIVDSRGKACRIYNGRWL